MTVIHYIFIILFILFYTEIRRGITAMLKDIIYLITYALSILIKLFFKIKKLFVQPSKCQTSNMQSIKKTTIHST